MKKLLTIAACGAIAMSVCATPLHAASNVNSAELEILNFMEKGVTINGSKINYEPGSDEYDMMKEYFNMDDVNLTDADVAIVKKSAKDVEAYLTKNWDETVTPEAIHELLTAASPAFTAMEMSVSYDAAKDVLKVTLKGVEPIEIEDFIGVNDAPSIIEKVEEEAKKPETGKGLENTGEDFTSTYMIIGSLAAVLLGAGYMALRKKEAAE